MTAEEIKVALKNFIVETLGVDGDLITDDVLLFGDSEIGLGSIDGLEIIAFIDSEYGVNMTGAPRECFANLNSIAEYTLTHKEENQ